MNSVEETKKRRGWNTSDLARKIGLDRRRLAELEQGRTLASAEMAKELETQGVLGLASTSNVISKRKLRSLRLRPYDFPEYNKEAWERAAAARPWLYSKLKRRDWYWMVRHIRADSTLECDLWTVLVLAGGKLALLNPHSCGFRLLPVVDEQGDALGERLLPCIHLKTKEIEVIIWPQVSLRPDKWTFRVDGLVLTIAPALNWSILEADGGGHNYEKDSFRSAQLLKDITRLTRAEIDSPHLLQILTKRLLAL